MKRVLALILALIMALSLAACGKSEAAKETEKLIEEIGEVELSDLAAIEAAEDSFNALSADDQAQVSNYDALVDARQQWDHLRTNGAREAAKDRMRIYCDLLYDVRSTATIERVHETDDDAWQIRGYVSAKHAGKTYSGGFECEVSFNRDSCKYDVDIVNMDKLTR